KRGASCLGIPRTAVGTTGVELSRAPPSQGSRLSHLRGSQPTALHPGHRPLEKLSKVSRTLPADPPTLYRRFRLLRTHPRISPFGSRRGNEAQFPAEGLWEIRGGGRIPSQKSGSSTFSVDDQRS